MNALAIRKSICLVLVLIGTTYSQRINLAQTHQRPEYEETGPLVGLDSLANHVKIVDGELVCSPLIHTLVAEYDSTLGLPEVVRTPTSNLCVISDFDGNGLNDLAISFPSRRNIIILRQLENTGFRIHAVQPLWSGNWIGVKYVGDKIDCIWDDDTNSTTDIKENYPGILVLPVERTRSDSTFIWQEHKFETNCLFEAGEGGISPHFVWNGQEFLNILACGD